MSIAQRLAEIRARVDAAARAAGRDPASVTLIAVSKTRPAEDVIEAMAAGQLDFGENYAQEARDKMPLVAPEARWHFIGHLQSNKAKYVAGKCALIHAVDSVDLAREIGKRGPGQPILVEVNVGGEASKSGVAPEQALALCREIVALGTVRLRGLMTIPPDDGAPRPYFERLAALAVEGRAEGLPLEELSMGMSGDFEEAIACGATMVRVGTAIFGARVR